MLRSILVMTALFVQFLPQPSPQATRQRESGSTAPATANSDVRGHLILNGLLIRDPFEVTVTGEDLRINGTPVAVARKPVVLPSCSSAESTVSPLALSETNHHRVYGRLSPLLGHVPDFHIAPSCSRSDHFPIWGKSH